MNKTVKKVIKWALVLICVAASALSLYDRVNTKAETDDTPAEAAQVQVIEA